MLAQDIAVLLKLSLAERGSNVLSKTLADELFIAPADISKSLHRSKHSGLLYWTPTVKQVNKTALLGIIIHALRYVFPPDRGPLVRGIVTGSYADPLKLHFVETSEPPHVWPYADGNVRGLSFSPLYKGAPRAALLDKKLYECLAMCDAIRGGRARERNLAAEKLEEALFHEQRSKSVAA